MINHKKDTCFQDELKQEGRTPPCSPPAGHVHFGHLEFFTVLHESANDHESSLVLIGDYK